MTPSRPDSDIDPDAPILVNAARIIPRRVAEILAWEPYITDPLRILELHGMRISAKRLRYTMEMFAPFYGPDFRAAIGQFKKIQQQLGDIHDADVLVPELTRYLRKVIEGGSRSTKRHDRQGGDGREKGEDDEVGVHNVDLDAAQGLLSLSKTRRDERDATYQQFLQSWSGLRADGFFDRLWVIVQQGPLDIMFAANAANAANATQATEPLAEGAGEGHGTTENGEIVETEQAGRNRRGGRRAGRGIAPDTVSRESKESNESNDPAEPANRRNGKRQSNRRSSRVNTGAGTDSGAGA